MPRADPLTPTFGSRLRQLRNDRGLSIHKFSLALYEADEVKAQVYDPSFISKIERGDRSPPTRFVLLTGEVLNPTPEEFPEYHLAMMRRALDEREIGLDQAMANLRRIDEAVIAEEEAEGLSTYLREQGEKLTSALSPPPEQAKQGTSARSGRVKKGRA